jgi:hypothetical protein
MTKPLIVIAAALLDLVSVIGAWALDPEACSKRQAIAAEIEAFQDEIRRAPGKVTKALSARFAAIERRIDALQPIDGSECPEDLWAGALTRKLEEAGSPIREAMAEAKRRETIMAKPWPEPIKRAVLERTVAIGMTTEQVEASWGPPNRVNETVTATTRHEQWVYGGTYLYFQNGRMTSYQRSR